ncbi:hypothetical protein VCHA43P273_90142 [Vibrio chagasii]|nr:hypothetical protein VCHA43P273_90142 [Vibrio chagasii]CAK2979255.1 hypothetical protein VCRA219O19_60022 [Vibrio crassostreae]
MTSSLFMSELEFPYSDSFKSNLSSSGSFISTSAFLFYSIHNIWVDMYAGFVGSLAAKE